MKSVAKILCVIVLSILSAHQLDAQSITKSVLFLGNSYTFGNNLPNMVSELASSAGDSLIVDVNAPGGHQLMLHAGNSTSLQKIAQGTWDYVVLQEQSQLPSWPQAQVEVDVFPFARLLTDSIRHANDCANPMFFMTWGRENGDQMNCQIFPWVCTYEGMDSALAANYTRMAIENKGVVSPVGKVWRKLRNELNLQMYLSDESHPNETGSYVAACTFYASIFKKDPTLCTWSAGINPGVAMLIRQATKTVVYDSLDIYDYTENLSNASLLTQVNYDTVSFSANGSVYDSLHWNLGDGSSNTNSSFTHTYADSGLYTVELITFKCGKSDTATEIITINLPPVDPGNPGDTLNVNNINFVSSVQIFPNPLRDELTIKSDEVIKSVSVFDTKGTLIYSSEVDQKTRRINSSSWQAGVYFIRISDSSENSFTKKIIKE